MATSDGGQELYVKGKLAMNAKNYKEMKTLFDQAVCLGNKSAMNDLAFYHQYIEVDHEKAIKYYLMAIETGNVGNACYNLACLYHERGDVENKMCYMTLASENGDARAHFGLGMHYEDIGDHENTLKFYKLAASNGLAKACTALGDCFLKQGEFVQAKDAFLQALRSGDGDAVYPLDDCRLTVSAEEHKEIFTLILKIHMPDSIPTHDDESIEIQPAK
jgi:TPR repeat protein